MILSEALDLYLKEECAGLKPESISTYEMKLRRLRSAVPDLPLEALSPDDFRPAVAVAMSELSKSSCRDVFSIWRRALDFCTQKGLQSECVRPMKIRTTGGGSLRSSSALNERETTLLCRELDKLSKPRWPLRLAVYLGLYAGLRRGEIVTLQLASCFLYEETPYIIVQSVDDIGFETKNSTMRMVPINSKLVREIELCSKFSKRFAVESRNRNRYPFNNRNSAIDTGLQKLLSKVGINKKGRGWHALRHTYATKLSRSGFGLLEIQQLLGHKDIATTQRYIAMGDFGSIGRRMERMAF